MKKDETVLLDKEILDHQLLDCDGRRCGNVDDLELSGGPGEALVVAAILSGPGEFRRRLPRAGRPLAWLLERLFGTGVTRIEWSEVAGHDGAIELRKKATDYGLGAGDDAAGAVIARIPGS
jgi:hypothetical protein